MSLINCMFATLSDGIDLPADLMNILQSTVREKFLDASLGHIQLSTSVYAPLATSPRGAGTRANELHTALTTITRNSLQPLNIAVLYCGFYNTPGYPLAEEAFGVMFDRGFATLDDPNEPMQHPRLGCAVFLDTIKKARPKVADYRKEVVFTTLHELGHIFNLNHIEDNQNIMSSSNSASVIDSKFWYFESAHSEQLCNCGNDFRVTPGYSSFIDNDPGIAFCSELIITRRGCFRKSRSGTREPGA